MSTHILGAKLRAPRAAGSWAAGLQLALLAMGDRRDVGAFVREFTGGRASRFAGVVARSVGGLWC